MITPGGFYGGAFVNLHDAHKTHTTRVRRPQHWLKLSGNQTSITSHAIPRVNKGWALSYHA